MPKKTKAQIAAEAELEWRLASARRGGYEEAKKDLTDSFKLEKLQQMKAITEMLEQAGRIMSRAGYLLGKANGDNGR